MARRMQGGSCFLCFRDLPVLPFLSYHGRTCGLRKGVFFGKIERVPSRLACRFFEDVSEKSILERRRYT